MTAVTPTGRMDEGSGSVTAEAQPVAASVTAIPMECDVPVGWPRMFRSGC